VLLPILLISNIFFIPGSAFLQRSSDWNNLFSHREKQTMPVTEIPQSGHSYQVQPVDKDHRSQKDTYKRREKKNLKKSKKQETSSTKSDEPHRINLIA